MPAIKLLDAVTGTQTGNPINAIDFARNFASFHGAANRTFQSYISGTGAVTATVLIEGSNDAVGWVLLQTHTLSGTTTDVAGVPSSAQWEFVRARLTAISGTGAAVTVTMGV